MKFTTILAAALVGTAHAFAPAQPAFARTTALNAKETSRSEFFTQAAGLVAAAVIAPGKANAAKYGSFGAGSPEVLNPSEAIVDEEILKSDAVQSALNAIKGYLTGVRQMEAALKSNGQTDVGPYLRKEFDFVKLREALNTVNTAYDEDTQRGTDRLIRNIMQDITELETANRQKDGVPRSSRRLEIMEGKLAKLGKAFEDYIAFAQ